MLPVLGALVCSLLAIEQVVSRATLPPRLLGAAATISLLALTAYTTIPLARLVAEPQYRDPFRVSHFLEERLEPPETALIVAPRDPLARDDAPILYQRVVAQTKIDRDRIRWIDTEPWGGRELLSPVDLKSQDRFLILFAGIEPSILETIPAQRQLRLAWSGDIVDVYEIERPE